MERDWDAEIGQALDGSNPPPLDMPERPAVTLVLIGSSEWHHPFLVTSVLDQWWTDAGQPPVKLVTSGCPTGAEAHARQHYANYGWLSISVRDEGLPDIREAIVFAFIKDHSPGAEEALSRIMLSNPWSRVFRDDTHRVVSPWATR